MTNSGFESSPLNANGWTTDPGTAVTYTWATDQHNEGTHALAITTTSRNGYGAISLDAAHRIPVTAGRTYVGSAHLFSSGVVGPDYFGGNVFLQFFDATGAALGGRYGSTQRFTGGNAWGTEAISHAAPTGATSLAIGIQLFGLGVLWADTVAVMEFVDTTGLLPVITVQPNDQTGVAGSAVSFSVTAAGVGTLTYQWSFKGTPIAGATLGTYSISAASTAQEGSYTVAVTNAYGTTTSGTATLTVSAAPTPNPPPSPAAPASGGGGALNLWFVVALGGLLSLRIFCLRSQRPARITVKSRMRNRPSDL